ncbi:NPL6 [[Candida] subhashii]|uniref:NPL6 n=1 Tax=[Candida] subhashii TaxID=561895 RepID=A0A8J5QQC1_9ASCO|nr:NPL6 [[Candida] subhashii]KAG7664680.1 NPL6 [[Candida] subhashii]
MTRNTTRNDVTEPIMDGEGEEIDVKQDDFEDDAINDDYVDEDIDEDEEEDQPDVEEEEDEEEIVARKTRKRKASTRDLAEQLEDNNSEINETQDGEEAPQETADIKEEDEEDEEEEGEEGEEDEGDHGDKPGPKKRGRKRTKFLVLEEGVFDEDGNPISIVNDEVVIPHEDPKGKEKIDELGYLKDGREFKMKTFKLLGQGDRLYMISTEPARLVGFRDSYLLFKTHLTLFKKVCTHEEKMDLIQRGLIPNSYKGRSVNLVTARSIFREFGSRMIKGGKKVIDDFWEQRALDNGDIPGELADPVEIFPNQSKLSSIFGEGVASGSGGGGSPLTATPIVNYQTDVTWMHQIAKKTQEYNTKLSEARGQTLTRGIRDMYSNSTFYPESTQPQKTIKISKLENDSNKLVYDIKMNVADLRRPITGLAKVPPEIFEDIEDEEIKRAIFAQQAYEKSL